MSENEKESATENTPETIDNTIVFDLNRYCPPDVESFKMDENNMNNADGVDEEKFLALGRKYGKLCRIAKIDAWHDHHTISGLEPEEISNFVSDHIPEGIFCYNDSSNTSGSATSLQSSDLSDGLDDDIQPSNEDVFLFRYLLNANTYLHGKENPKDKDELQKKMKEMAKPNCNPYILDYQLVDNKPLFNENFVTNRYIVGHVPFVSKEEKEDIKCDPKHSFDANVSQVQRFFEDHEINEDIYIIRDVAYGNWADDIKKWKQTNGKKDTKIVTIQSAAGIFDPGPSTHYYSGAGIRQGFSDPTSKSHYGLFDTRYSRETEIVYPKVEPEEEDTITRNQLLYTRFDCTLHGNIKENLEDGIHLKKNVQNFIESTNTTLVVKDGEDYYLSRKHNSNKAQSITELPKQDIVIHLTSKESGNLDSELGRTYQFEQYITNSGRMRIMSKKFGDHGQAVTACRSTLSYRLFQPTNSSEQVEISSNNSNGIHAFLSFDRVAVVSAIYYGAPIVIFTNHHGALIFVSKTLKDSVTKPETKLNSLKLSFEKHQIEYEKKMEEIKKLTGDSSIRTIINNKKDNIKKYLTTIQGYIQQIYNYLLNDDAYINFARSDIVYQSLLSILFMTRTYINFYITNIVKKPYAFMGEYNSREETNEKIKRENEGKYENEVIYNTLKAQYEEHEKEIENETINDETIENEIKKRIDYLNRITVIVNRLQDNISNYIIIDNVEGGLEKIATIITSTTNSDPYKYIYNVMSQLKIANSTKERFDSCNPYSGTQNPRYWRSKLKKESYQTPLGVSLCLPDFVVITENIDDYVFNGFNLTTEIEKNVTFSIIFTIILNKLYNKCQLDLKTYLYVSLGLKKSEDKLILDPESRCSLNLKSIVDVELLLEENIDLGSIINVSEINTQTTIKASSEKTSEESTLKVEEIEIEEKNSGFVREPYNLRSQVKITRSGKKFGGKQNRKRRIKRTRRRKTIKKRRTKRKRKVRGGSETQTQTQTQEKFDNLSSEQLYERGKNILNILSKYPKDRSDIRKNNLQEELKMINDAIKKMGKTPVTQTPFSGVGKKLGDSSSSYYSMINNSIRNITRIMKQNKVVREANTTDRLTKSFDEHIRRTYILKQCEVALTIIGKLILMNNPNLMKDSESKSQNGGTIDDIADKIESIKQDGYNSTNIYSLLNKTESNERNVGFDDTHPFTLLESMINYNGLLNEISNVFIEQYDLEMRFEYSENTESNKVQSKYIIDNIITVLNKNKIQLASANKIAEEVMKDYPETYEGDDKIVDYINNYDEKDIDIIIEILNEEPPLRKSTRVIKSTPRMTTDEQGNYVDKSTTGYK